MGVDPRGESVIASLFIGMLIGFVSGAAISGGFEIAKQAYNNGNWNWDVTSWDWGQIGLSALGGGVAGAISSINIGSGIASWFFTFLLGGTGSVVGGLISGSVTDWGSAAMAFAIGSVANIVARGITAVINKCRMVASKKSLSKFIYDDMSLDDIIAVDIKNNNLHPSYNKFLNQTANKLLIAKGYWAKSFMYSFANSGISSILSGWY